MSDRVLCLSKGLRADAPARHSAWRDPIFRRYCQSRLRLRGLGVALLITMLVAGFIVAMSPLAKVLACLCGLPVREYAMALATAPFTAWSLRRGEGRVAGLAPALRRRLYRDDGVVSAR